MVIKRLSVLPSVFQEWFQDFLKSFRIGFRTGFRTVVIQGAFQDSLFFTRLFPAIMTRCKLGTLGDSLTASAHASTLAR
jgi:hypothetical protein